MAAHSSRQQFSIALRSAAFMALLSALTWAVHGWSEGPAELKAAAEPGADAPTPPPAGEAPEEPTIKLNFANAPWQKVLEQVAEQSGSTLVMDRAPSGTFKRMDRHRYSRTEAVRIINNELEQDQFRVIEKGEFLIVLQLDSLRARYRRPELPKYPAADDPSAPRLTTPSRSFQKPQRSVHDITTRDRPLGRQPAQTKARAAHQQIGPAAAPSADSATVPVPAQPTAAAAQGERTVAHAGHEDVPAPASEPEPFLQPKPVTEETAENAVVTVKTRHSAVEVARVVFDAFKLKAELVDEGTQGLPSFRVYKSQLQRAVGANAEKINPNAKRPAPLFEIGLDEEGNALVIEAAPVVANAVSALARRIDAEQAQRGGKSLQLVASEENVTQIAQRLQPQIKRLLAQTPRPAAPRRAAQAFEAAQLQNDGQAPEPGVPPEQPLPEGQPPEGTRTVLPQNPQILPLIEALRGDVTVEAVPDLGVLILRGNQRDVEAVLQVIQQLEQLSQGTVPDIHLLYLKYVNSAALAELLTSVYEQLGTLRSRGGTTQATIGVIPVVKPNAVIVLAPERDMPSILKLAEELDQPVDPQSEFEVFQLRNAVASQVVTLIEEFYEERTGLGARVVASADVRTNSVVVQARPSDLLEVAALVRRVDRADTKSVNRMQVFPLRNATAAELAQVINVAIQSVLSPPTTSTTGAFGQAGAAAPGAAQIAQQFRDAKSAVLEFLAIDGEAERLLRSGILADIRITADPRINSLVVTAPEASMALVGELIRALDQPSNLVAEIKVFTLANSDATATAELLQTLFAAQTQQGIGGQQQALGIQVAGAEDASSGLIPLRFSVDVRTNAIIAIGPADALRIVEAIILRLDESDVRQRQTTVVKLRNSPATEVGDAINRFLQSQRELAQLDPELVSNVELLEREIIVEPEFVSNSLLISATPRYYEEILTLVAQLDQPPPQVIIQALLVEVELQNTDEFGVELGFQDSVLFDRSVINNLVTISETVTAPNGVQTTSQRIISQESQPGFLFNNQQLGNNTAVEPAQVGTQGLSNFSLGRVNGDLGFGGLVLAASSESVSVLIRALAAKRKVHILSRPQIRTLDNQLAEIQVGQQVPVVRGVTVNTLGGANPNVTPEDVGIILSVTPRISPDGTIVMETIATKSALSPEGVPIFTDITTGNVVESPIIDISTARSVVSIPNGQTIVMGGMITKSDESIERKVPFLGDIPLLGLAFRYDGVTTRRTELLIFLTPRVIRHDEDSELIKRVEAERVHFIEREAEEIHGPLYAVPPGSGWGTGPEACPPGIYPDESFEFEMTPPPAPAGEDAADEDDVPTTVMPASPLPPGPVLPLAPVPPEPGISEPMSPQPPPASPPQQLMPPDGAAPMEDAVPGRVQLAPPAKKKMGFGLFGRKD